MKPSLQKSHLLLAPLGGSLLFLVLYVLAALAYPGGSQADAHAKGFSWMHNYWCNLLNGKALNGEPNGGRPFAFAAMTVLALTLLAFWIITAQGFGFSKRSKTIIIGSGLMSIGLLPFLPTAYHDPVINTSASLGLLAMAFIYTKLYKKGWKPLFLFGLFNLLLVAVNNYIYYRTSLYYLPLVQKFTFLSFLLWVCLVTLKLYRHQREA